VIVRPHKAGGSMFFGTAMAFGMLAVVSSLACPSLPRREPQEDLANAAAELQSIILGAKESALATGHPVAVLVFPGYTDGSQRKGRFVVYQDACGDFFTRALACGVSFATYDPASLTYGHIGKVRSKVVKTMDLPPGIIIRRPPGVAAGTTLPPPLSDIRADTACSFCGTTGGAVRFDPDGRPSFYSVSYRVVTGPLPAKTGASLSLGPDPAIAPGVDAHRTLVILVSTGAVVRLGQGTK
jgi:hypothetical protein